MVGLCGEAEAEQRPPCRQFSNHAAERYGSTRGARSPGVNPWLVARSVSYHGHEQLSHITCSPEGISSLAEITNFFVDSVYSFKRYPRLSKF